MNREIVVRTQAELDAVPIDFSGTIYITGGTLGNSISVSNSYVSSRVVARGDSHVEARGNSHVEAWENSHVVARENSRVVARENSHVEARDNSHVVALGYSRVVARGDSHVEAWENSHVVARENSRVVAWENVGVWLYSDNSTVFLFMFSVCWKLGKGQVTRRSKSATVITPKPLDWFDANCVENKKTITLYKRVSSDFRTQEGKANETTWTIGSTLKVPNWNPDNSECGEGKFHACSRPYFCDEFRSTVGDRYIAISVKRKDTHQWPSPAYPHKIAFREGKVLYEVDRYGTRI